MQYVFFEKGIGAYAVYNGVWGKAPEAIDVKKRWRLK